MMEVVESTTADSSSAPSGGEAEVKMSPEMKELLEENRTPKEHLDIEKQKRGERRGARIDEIRDMTYTRHYHELSGKLREYLTDDDNFTAMEKAAFFHHVVAKLKWQLCPLRYCRLLSLVAEELHAADGLCFLDHHESGIERDDEAHLHFQTSRAFQLTRLALYKQCGELLEAVKKKINEHLGLPPSVNASYHRSCATLYKAQGKHSEFYKHAVLFLAYTPINEIPENEKEGLAYEIVVAAILAPDVFNFSELHEHALISSSLVGTTHQWLYDLLHAFAEGKLSAFDDVVSQHQQRIAVSELAAHETSIRQKMTLLALMELCFRRPKKQRVLAFEEIATHCRVPLKKVELLVMKAMSNGLMSGSMDEVEQTLRVTWVQPRILDTARIKVMKQRVDSWVDAASKLLLHLEELTPELLVS